MSLSRINSQEKFGLVALYLASFFWGSAFIAQKILVDSGITPFYMVTLRMLFALFLIVFVKNIPLQIQTIKKGAILGFIIFLVFGLQTFGLKTIDSSLSSFITSLNIVLIPFVNFFMYRAKIKWINIISIMIALIGIYFFNLTSDFKIIINIGMVLTILCAISCAVQLVVGNQLIRDEHPLQLAIVQNLFCCVYAFISALIFEGGVQNFPRNWNFSSIISIIYLGIVASSICFFLLSIGQKYVKDVVKVGLIMSLQPLFTLLIAVPILGEKITLFKVIGMSCIMLSIFVHEYYIKIQKNPS